MKKYTPKDVALIKIQKAYRQIEKGVFPDLSEMKDVYSIIDWQLQARPRAAK